MNHQYLLILGLIKNLAQITMPLIKVKIQSNLLSAVIIKIQLTKKVFKIQKRSSLFMNCFSEEVFPGGSDRNKGLHKHGW